MNHLQGEKIRITWWSFSIQAAQFTVSAAFASRVAVPSMAFTLHLGNFNKNRCNGGNFGISWTKQDKAGQTTGSLDKQRDVFGHKKRSTMIRDVYFFFRIFGPLGSFVGSSMSQLWCWC